MKVRRGFWVVTAWLIWPFIAVVLDYFIRLSVSTSRRCSIEGCDFDPGLLDLLLLLGPPVLVTVWWWRGRRRNAERE